MPNRTVRRTCKRCGEVDIVEKDMEPPFGIGGKGHY